MTKESGIMRFVYIVTKITTDMRFNASTLQRFNTAKPLVIFSRFMLVLMLALVLDSCSSKRIAKANVDQVTEGMSKKQVESILGPPTSLKTEDLVIMKKTTYVYRQARTQSQSFSRMTKCSR